MWSLQDLSLRKPACPLRISFSRLPVKSSSITLVNALPVTLRELYSSSCYNPTDFPFS